MFCRPWQRIGASVCATYARNGEQDGCELSLRERRAVGRRANVFRRSEILWPADSFLGREEIPSPGRVVSVTDIGVPSPTRSPLKNTTLPRRFTDFALALLHPPSAASRPDPGSCSKTVPTVLLRRGRRRRPGEPSSPTVLPQVTVLSLFSVLIYYLYM